jgi:hypothetical protein
MVVMEELVPMCDRGEIAGFSPTSEIDGGGHNIKVGQSSLMKLVCIADRAEFRCAL